ncbi:MAG: ECF transporter S component [Clostridia bacterium]
MKNSALNTRKLVVAGLFCALITVLTMISISVPGGMGAFIHFGDAVVFVAAYFLGGLYGSLSAGIGSALADIILGVPMYAPATFIIKGAMAFLACFLVGKLGRKKYFISFLIAGLIMPIGYFLYEWVLLSFPVALANIPYNLIQYAAGIAVSTVLLFALNKINIKGGLMNGD